MASELVTAACRTSTDAIVGSLLLARRARPAIPSGRCLDPAIHRGLIDDLDRYLLLASAQQLRLSSMRRRLTRGCSGLAPALRYGARR